MKHFFTLPGWDAGPIVFNRHAARAVCMVDAPFDDDGRCSANGVAGLRGVAQQIAEHLPEKNFVALNLRELACHIDRRSGGQLMLKIVSRAPRNPSKIDGCERELL